MVPLPARSDTREQTGFDDLDNAAWSWAPREWNRGFLYLTHCGPGAGAGPEAEAVAGAEAGAEARAGAEAEARAGPGAGAGPEAGAEAGAVKAGPGLSTVPVIQ